VSVRALGLVSALPGRAGVLQRARLVLVGRVAAPPRAREVVDLLDGLGPYDEVAVVRLERWLRARSYDEQADRGA